MQLCTHLETREPNGHTLQTAQYKTTVLTVHSTVWTAHVPDVPPSVSIPSISLSSVDTSRSTDPPVSSARSFCCCCCCCCFVVVGGGVVVLLLLLLLLRGEIVVSLLLFCSRGFLLSFLSDVITLDREGASTSKSSNNSTHGASVRATANVRRILASVWPVYRDSSCTARTCTRLMLASAANALTHMDLPHPGGPYSSTPEGGVQRIRASRSVESKYGFATVILWKEIMTGKLSANSRLKVVKQGIII
jgi:hypothetical protein